MDYYRKGSFIAGSFERGGQREQIDDDVARFKRALAMANIVAEQNGWSNTWLVGETAKDLRSSAVQRTFTPQQVSALRSKKPIPLGGSTTLRFTTRNMMGSSLGQAILALYPTEKLLKRLDELHEDHAVIVVPWSGDHVPRWAETWGARNIMPGGEHFERPIIKDEVVRNALNDLVNVSVHGGLTYPSDLPMFRETFKRLKKEGHHFSEAAIRSFVIVESYRGVENADKIAKAARRYADPEPAKQSPDDA